MPVNLQSLQSFAGITDLDRLKVNDNNELTQRSNVGTFFRKVGDAFLRLSQSGRASIAARNERILGAMRATVEAARRSEAPEVRSLTQRLTDAAARLQGTVSDNMGAVLSDRLHDLQSSRGFRRLPVTAQRAMTAAYRSIARNHPMPEWRNLMNAIKADFLSPSEGRCNMPEGLRLMKENLVSGFLSPTQQAIVDDTGVHEAFVKDTRRRNISHIGGEAIPHIRSNNPDEAAPEGALPKEAVSGLCTERLRALVGPEHQRFMPFITMMASQAGLDSAPSFLPQMSGLSDVIDMHLTEANIMPANSEHIMTIDREGNDLVLAMNFHATFKNAGAADPEDPVALSRDGRLTMRIHLDQAPDVHTVTLPAQNDAPTVQRDVLIPQFSLENADLRYIPGDSGLVCR